MNKISQNGVASLLGIGLFSAGLLIAGYTQPANAGICFNHKITASSHSYKNALRGVAQKTKARHDQLAARGVNAAVPYAPTCKSISGRTTCTMYIRTCQ